MTVLVGVHCSDGAVVAADSWASYAASGGVPTLGGQVYKKVHAPYEKMLFACSGAVAVSQTIQSLLVKARADLGSIRDAVDMKSKIEEKLAAVLHRKIAAAASGEKLDRHAALNAVTASLIAVGAGQDRVHLMQMDMVGNCEVATDELPIVSLGSGQAYADPFLGFIKRVIWAGRAPTVADGTLAAVWTIQHVVKTNGPGVGVGGTPVVGVLRVTKSGVVMEWPNIDEHLQNIDVLEAAIRDAAMNEGKATAPQAAEPAAPSLKNRV